LPGGANRALFAHTPAKAAAALAALSPVLSVGSPAEEQSPDDDRKMPARGNMGNMPAVSNGVKKFALLVGTSLGGRSGTVKWQVIRNQDLAEMLTKTKASVQVQDCTCLLLDSGEVIPAVHHVKGYAYGRSAKFCQEALAFGEEDKIESIQACGPVLLAISSHGTLYVAAYQGKGVFNKPDVIFCTDVVGLGPTSLFGFISDDLQKDVCASLYIMPLKGETKMVTSSALELPKLRLSVKLACGSDKCLMLAYDSKGAGAVYRLTKEKLSKVSGTFRCCVVATDLL
jgi:hypothetical protein